MDHEAVLQRLREEEERTAIGWAGARGQEDQAAAIRELLERERSEPHSSITVKISMEDRHMRPVFVTLCRRYGLKPYREPRQRRSTYMLKGPETFVQEVLLPLFNACEEIVRVEVNRWLLGLMASFNEESTDHRSAPPSP